MDSIHDPDGSQGALHDFSQDIKRPTAPRQEPTPPLKKLFHKHGVLIFVACLTTMLTLGGLIYFIPFKEGWSYVLALLVIINLMGLFYATYCAWQSKFMLAIPVTFAILFFMLTYRILTPSELARLVNKEVQAYLHKNFGDDPPSDSALVHKIDSIVIREITIKLDSLPPTLIHQIKKRQVHR